MGVSGLQTYVRGCKKACEMVPLKEKADAHRKKFNCRPELVVDGKNVVIGLYFKSGLEWIYDAQWFQFQEYLREFLEKFRNIDVELVFVFDGTVSSSKRDQWARQKLQKCKIIEEIFGDIENRWKTARVLPTSNRIMMSFLLKELGAKVIQTVREGDDVIVHYAKNDNVFGILSEDSDFLIHDTKDVFSVKYLNLDTLETRFYDRRCLAETYLRLDVKQLPLFACLLGNDFVPYEKLKCFHYNLLKNQGRCSTLISSLSSLIRGKKWTGNAFNLNQLKEISREVCKNEEGICEEDVVKRMHMIKEGLKTYVVENRAPPPPTPIEKIPLNLKDEVLRRHANCSITADIFNLLFYQEYGSSEVMENTRLPDKPSALIYQEIRRRCYSILFNFSQIPSKPSEVVVKEYCAYLGNMLDRPESVLPLPLNLDKVPAIDDVWFEYSAIEKYQVFRATLQIPMDLDRLMNIQNEYLVFSCIINFLIGGSSTEPHLHPFDVAAFVAQAVWEKNISELNDLKVQSIKPRAVNLTTLFMRGVDIVLLALGVCDYPFPFAYADPCHFFDGKQFHYLYSTAINENRTVKYLSRSQDCRNKFYRLLEDVTNNTIYDPGDFNWREVLEDFEH